MRRGLLRDSYRIMDANFNRSKEGLRVCEEIARFHLRDKGLTKRLYGLRHRLTTLLLTSDLDLKLLWKERDAQGDPGKTLHPAAGAKSFRAIFMANAQRVKEALRVLEEFLKLFDSPASRRLQKLRFDFYVLEKQAVEKF